MHWVRPEVVVEVACLTWTSPSVPDVPCGTSRLQTCPSRAKMRGMVKDDPEGPYTIRATNPKLDPPEVIEVCHSKAAMQMRAANLYRAG